MQIKVFRQPARERYNKSPKFCNFCKNEMEFEKRRGNFCSRSCAAAFNNKGVRRHGEAPSFCLVCKEKLDSSIRIFCSHKCQFKHRWEGLKRKIIDGSYVTSSASTYALMKFCIEERGRTCEKCLMDKWMGELIPLSVHHKNGDAMDNHINNLELLCLNCHGLTSNFGRKNKKSTRKDRHKTRAVSSIG